MWQSRGEATEERTGDMILIGDRHLASGSNVWLEGDVVVFIVSSLKI